MPLGPAFLECCAICYLCDYELDKQTQPKTYAIQVTRPQIEVPVSTKRVNYPHYSNVKNTLNPMNFEDPHYQIFHYTPNGFQG